MAIWWAKGVPGLSKGPKPQEPATKGPVEVVRANLWRPVGPPLPGIKVKPTDLGKYLGAGGGAAGKV